MRFTAIWLGLVPLGLLLPTDLGADAPPAAPPADAVTLGKQADPPLLIELSLAREVESRFVPLRELVQVVHDHDDVWDVVGDVRIRVREGGFVRRADLRRRIERAGLADSRYRVSGPAFCLCEVTEDSSSTSVSPSDRTSSEAKATR